MHNSIFLSQKNPIFLLLSAKMRIFVHPYKCFAGVFAHSLLV